MPGLLTPTRRRGVEYLDDAGLDPATVTRSLADVARSNRLFGGARAVLAELDRALGGLSGDATLLDVGTGIGDIPELARARAARRGVRLTTIGLDGSPVLAAASSARTGTAVCADARSLPFADGSIEIVTCSQVLHHFPDDEAEGVVRELARVAQHMVIVADLRRSWLAVAGIWLASFPLRFHPISRHDGVVSVLRGYTPVELEALVRRGSGVAPAVTRRLGFRVTASWRPGGRDGELEAGRERVSRVARDDKRE